jgi:hypothetical protein
MHNAMSNYERKRLELELKQFASRNFERPSKCRNLDQLRFYVKELCLKIEEFEKQFNYVPNNAYALLAQYNERQNSMLHLEFKNSYC